MTLLDIIHRCRRGFILAMSLVVVEKLAWIIEPTVFGRLIDSLIAVFGSKQEVSYALPLALWIVVFSINSGVGALRRSVDARIYLKMFTKIAVHVAESSRAKGLNAARSAARVELSREYVNFLQRRVPDFIEQFFDLGGTITALAFYDRRISLTCLCIVIPLLFISRIYNRKVLGLQAELHDMREDVYQIFQNREIGDIKSYYEKLAGPQIRIARLGALNFGVLRLFLLGIFLVVLYIAIDIDDFSTGQIYSIVAYLWTFVTSTEYLPDLMESYTSLKDVQRRVRSETPAEGLFAEE
jgi:ABC-type multidrug transport system fused ATPase/permease subunit